MNMTSSKVYLNENDEIHKIKVQRYKKEEKISDFTIKTGSKLIVNQMNKQATKNRGREVEVTGFLISLFDTEHKVKVKYLDTNRPGRIAVSDLDSKQK